MFPILFKLISSLPWFLLVGISRVFAYIFMLFKSSQYKVTKKNISIFPGSRKSEIQKFGRFENFQDVGIPDFL